MPHREGGIQTASVNTKFIPFTDKLEARTLESHRFSTEGTHNTDPGLPPMYDCHPEGCWSGSPQINGDHHTYPLGIEWDDVFNSGRQENPEPAGSRCAIHVTSSLPFPAPDQVSSLGKQ